MKLPGRFIVITAMLAVVELFPAAAQAHKVNIFAYAEGGRVYTESYYADGGRCIGSKVTVEDSTGAQLLEGSTDGDGRFSFDIPAAQGDLRVVVHAGMGHQNHYVIKAGELEAASADEAPEGKPELKSDKTVKGEPPVTKEAGAGAVNPGSAHAAAMTQPSSLSAEEMRVIVDEVVEARLKPVFGMLADLERRADRPAIQDTISGIGYIMGIMAVILFLRSRRK